MPFLRNPLVSIRKRQIILFAGYEVAYRSSMNWKNHPREIVLYTTVVITGFGLLAYFNLFEFFHQFTRDHESYNLDEVILLLPLLLICLSIYSFRRSRDLRLAHKKMEEANRKLQTAYERIQELSRSRQQFMAVACHELKSPLIGAINALRLLEVSESEQEAQELTGLALESLDSLQLLIGDVLRFTQLANRESPIEDAPFPVRETLESIVRIGKQQISDDRDLSLALELDETVPAEAQGNKGWLRLICLNLVSNAIKFTPKGSITVRSTFRTVPRSELVIRVTDTGIGIPEEKHALIFEPYERAEGVTREKREGLGLGLSVVRELVTRLDGSISLESEVGTGSTFTVILPMERLQESTA